MCDREMAWLKDAELQMGPIPLGAPLPPSRVHEEPWYGLEPRPDIRCGECRIASVGGSALDHIDQTLIFNDTEVD
jgi:hypothetical protein